MQMLVVLLSVDILMTCSSFRPTQDKDQTRRQKQWLDLSHQSSTDEQV